MIQAEFKYFSSHFLALLTNEKLTQNLNYKFFSPLLNGKLVYYNYYFIMNIYTYVIGSDDLSYLGSQKHFF